jgi:hypothetical protein
VLDTGFTVKANQANPDVESSSARQLMRFTSSVTAVWYLRLAFRETDENTLAFLPASLGNSVKAAYLASEFLKKSTLWGFAANKLNKYVKMTEKQRRYGT